MVTDVVTGTIVVLAVKVALMAPARTVTVAGTVVTPVLLADLGFFSQALGTAELLAGGDYHFDAGFSFTTPAYAQSIEVFPDPLAARSVDIHGDELAQVHLDDVFALAHAPATVEAGSRVLA